MGEQLLKLENLSISYKVKDGYLSAVKDINLTLDRGEILAIVGESGCGKSTIAHAIMRLLPDHNEIVEGKIIFRGEDLQEKSEEELVKIRGRDIGMIFQNPLDSLDPVYTSAFQVGEAIRLDNKSKKQAYDETLSLFRDVRLPDPERQMKRFPHELSGGMRQRVMIAMMLSRNPELLIADEPTTALDVTIESQIMDIVVDLKNQYNTAVLLITHNFGLVAEVADRVAVMYAGTLMEEGDVFEVFDAPKHPYTRLLMQALPRKTKEEGLLQTIEGSVPRLIDAKPGCRFANRCPYAMEICKTVDPPKIDAGGTHVYYCHAGEEGDHE
ncbi:MAG: ABC transporter ATP-binding protein [Eubacterium sp.]|nr:ABC transporter ATP-binding protein [Eubacterium sp.]